MSRPVVAILSFLSALSFVACFSPSGAYREIRSDRHRPAASDLAGTWRVSSDSAPAAAATGLPLADVRSGFISFKPDGTCSADIYDMPCGSFPAQHRRSTDACQWTISNGSEPTIILTFGLGRESASIEIHRLESDPPLLWQYICDPDWAEYLEFRRVQ